jgi:hypothetical protein
MIIIIINWQEAFLFAKNAKSFAQSSNPVLQALFFDYQ